MSEVYINVKVKRSLKKFFFVLRRVKYNLPDLVRYTQDQFEFVHQTDSFTPISSNLK